MSDEVVYNSHVQLERVKGRLRRAYLPAEEEPIYFGLNAEIADYYKADLSARERRPTPFDYMVAATAA